MEKFSEFCKNAVTRNMPSCHASSYIYEYIVYKEFDYFRRKKNIFLAAEYIYIVYMHDLAWVL